MAQTLLSKHLTVLFSAEAPYAAHVEINRMEKFNAFFEV
jgi:hypothetical protein